MSWPASSSAAASPLPVRGGTASRRSPTPWRLRARRRWDDAVLLSDLGSVWLIDAATGAQRFSVDLVTGERAASREDNPDHLSVEISRVVAAAGHAFVNLGTATVAIDRQGHQLWRRARTTPPDGRPPPAASPPAAHP